MEKAVALSLPIDMSGGQELSLSSQPRWDEGGRAFQGPPEDLKWVFFCQETQKIGSCLIPEKAETVQGGRLGWR